MNDGPREPSGRDTGGASGDDPAEQPDDPHGGDAERDLGTAGATPSARSRKIAGGVIAAVLLVQLLVVAGLSARSGDDAPVTTAASPWVATPTPLTSADSSCYTAEAGTAAAPRSTTNVTAAPVATPGGSGVQFVDVTRAAGLCVQQSTLATPPNCLFSSPGDVPGADEDAAVKMFTKCSEERMSGGAAVGDVDGDGRVDVYLTQLRQGAPGRLLRNNGDGTFADRTTLAGLDRVQGNGNGAAFADVDNDGHLDLVVTTIGPGQRYFLFHNRGDGTFEEDGIARGVAMDDGQEHRGFTIAVGDYDHDGYVDLFFTEWRQVVYWDNRPRPHAKLFRNRGAAAPGFFEDATDRAHVQLGDPQRVAGEPDLRWMIKNDTWRSASFAATFTDLDGDGWPELVVASDYGTSQLFWNNGDGTFTDGTVAAGVGGEGNGMGSAIGDFDGDGRRDWLVTAIYPQDPSQPGSSYYRGNRLYRNEGNRHFAEVTKLAKVVDDAWGWGAVFDDLDGDTKPDLVMTNGEFIGMYQPALAERQYANTAKRVFLNNGDGTFRNVTEASGFVTRGEGKGLVVFDYDGDGVDDVLTVNNGAYPTLYRNVSGAAARRLAISVRGTTSNRQGLGAVIRLRGADGTVQVFEVGQASGFLGQSDRTWRPSVGAATGPFTIEVTFPATGRTVTVRDVRPGTPVEVVEPAG